MTKLGLWLLALPRPVAWGLCLAWYALVTWLSSRQGGIEPRPWWWVTLSNGAHAPLFGLLACWLALLVPRERGWPALRAPVRVTLCALIALLGFVDELHQSIVPGRDMSALDVLTDVAGAAVALEFVAHLGAEARRGAGLWARLALAVATSLACGALATWLPLCFPGVGWF
ncbi:MAG: hypothetical protein FJ298_09945 [Planctomycetes bacterium]|nr:hypothetical protein [Planctomycetota bacterium]